MTDDKSREAFERWLQGTTGWKRCAERKAPMLLKQTCKGSYCDYRVNDRWLAWKACERYRDEQEKQA